MKHTKYFLLVVFFAIVFSALFISQTPDKFSLLAQQGANPYSTQSSMPQNVRDIRIPNTALLNTVNNPSFTANSSNTYSLNIMGEQKNFTFIAIYGPNPCTPVNEGGNAYFAIGVCPQPSSSGRYVYAPKKISYRVVFKDGDGNLLKAFQGVSDVNYDSFGISGGKKVIGWVYGFYKPETVKSQAWGRSFKMSYKIQFVNNSPSNTLQFDLLAHKVVPMALAKSARAKNYNSVYRGADGKKHTFMASRSGTPLIGAEPASYTSSAVPSFGLMDTGRGISPAAGGGPVSSYGVDIVTGALVYNYIDMVLPGGLSITRHYNSAMGYQPGRCFGWMFNFDEFLRFDPDGSVFYRQCDFNENRFAKAGFYDYLPAKPGNLLKLTAAADGNYEITFKNQSKKIFNSLGLLIKDIDNNGNTVSYTWNLPIRQIRENYDMPPALAAATGPIDSFRANCSLVITDPYNRNVNVSFDGDGRVKSISDWAGRTTEYSWYPGGILWKFKDVAGNYSSFIYPNYNSNGNPNLSDMYSPTGFKIRNNYLSQSVPDAHVVKGQNLYNNNYGWGNITYTYGWKENPQKKQTIVNEMGKVSTYYYDDNGTVTKIEKPTANNSFSTLKFGADAANNLLSKATNPLGNDISFSYDQAGNTSQVKLADGKNVRFTYDRLNRLTDYYDAAGRHTHYEYDDRGNLVSVENKDGTKILLEYNFRGNLTKSTDENGHYKTYEYGIYGDLARTTDEEGGAITFYRDTLGRMVQTNSNGLIYKFTYNNFGLPTQITDGLGNNTNISYNADNNVTSVTDARGNKSQYSYDSMDQLTRATDPEGNSTTYQYGGYNGWQWCDTLSAICDPMGRNITFYTNSGSYVSSIKDQTYNYTYYNYDANGSLTRVNNPTAIATYTYTDSHGVITQATKPVGGTNTEFVYDNLNRVIKKNADNKASYEYDAAGNLTKVTDNSGETLYEYDAMGRLVKKTYPFGGAVYRRKFDNAGNLVYEKQINGDEFNYEYDKAGRLSSITKKGGGTLSCRYNEGQLPAMIEYPNGVTKYIAYDDNKNIVRIKYISSKTGEVVYEVNYEYDELSRIISKKESSSQNTGKKISYAYDKAGRLTQVASDGAVISQYTYDKNGNRLTSQTLKGAAQYSYDAANRLLKAGNTTYVYDTAGNLISKNTSDEARTYQYDQEHNLKTVNLIGTNQKPYNVFYDYSADNLRISRNSTADTNKAYTCWFGGQLLGKMKENGDTDFINYGWGFKNSQGDYCYITDIQGSIVGVTDKNGNVVSVYKYDEFGNPITTIETAGAQGSPAPTPTASAPAAPVSQTPASATPTTKPSAPTPGAPAPGAGTGAATPGAGTGAATPGAPTPGVGTGTTTPNKPQFPINYVPATPSPTATPSQAVPSQAVPSQAVPSRAVPSRAAPQKSGTPHQAVQGGATSTNGTSAGRTSSGGTSAGGTSTGSTNTASTSTSGTTPSTSQTQNPYNENILGRPTPPGEEIKTPGAGAPGAAAPGAAAPAPKQTIKNEKAKPALRQEDLKPIKQAPVPRAPVPQAPTPQVDTGKIKKPITKPTASPTIFTPTPSPTLPYTPMPSQQQNQVTPSPAVSATPSPVPSTDVKPDQGVIRKVIDTIVNFFKNLFKTSKASVFDLINSLFGGGSSLDEQTNKIESPIRFAGYYYDKDTGLYYVQSRYYDPEAGRFTQADKISYAGGLNLYAYCGNDPVNNTDPAGTQSAMPQSGTVVNPNWPVNVPIKIGTPGWPQGSGGIPGASAYPSQTNVITPNAGPCFEVPPGSTQGAYSLNAPGQYARGNPVAAMQRPITDARGVRINSSFGPLARGLAGIAIDKLVYLSNYKGYGPPPELPNNPTAGMEQLWGRVSGALVAMPWPFNMAGGAAKGYIDSELDNIKLQYAQIAGTGTGNGPASGNGTAAANGSGIMTDITGSAGADSNTFSAGGLTLRMTPGEVRVPTSGSLGGLKVEIYLVDSNGAPINGAVVSLGTNRVGAFNTEKPVTDSSGYASAIYESGEGRSQAVEHTITASFGGAAASGTVTFLPSPCANGVWKSDYITYCSPGSTLTPTSVGPNGILTLRFSICRKCGIACSTVGSVSVGGDQGNIEQYSADGGPWKPISQLQSEQFLPPGATSYVYDPNGATPTHWHTVLFKIKGNPTQVCGRTGPNDWNGPWICVYTAGRSYFDFEILNQ